MSKLAEIARRSAEWRALIAPLQQGKTMGEFVEVAPLEDGSGVVIRYQGVTLTLPAKVAAFVAASIVTFVGEPTA